MYRTPIGKIFRMGIKENPYKITIAEYLTMALGNISIIHGREQLFPGQI
jgi:hypothetical protein